MRFPDSYFEAEVREGFYVASMMKRAWAAQLEILSDIDAVCSKHNIQYFAEWGTLLGAVRHGGFIPWDDDMDICMKREDYARFLAIAKEELPEGYFLRNFYTDDTYTEMLTRVLNGTQINFEKEFLEKFHGCPYAMGIDIFPMDFIAPDEEEDLFLREMIVKVMETANALAAGTIKPLELEMQIRTVEEMCNIRIDRRASIKKQLFALAERLFTLYGEQEAEEITLMPLWVEKRKYKLPKSCYKDVFMMPFEYTKVPVPVLYGSVLEKKYGEYMRQVRDGGSHEYPLYRGQEEALRDRVGCNPYTYVFTAQDLEHSVKKKSVRSQIRESISLLKNLHSKLKKEYQSGNAAGMMGLLPQCQDAAIALGTWIEESCGEGTDAVSRLEEYCEWVYRVYQEVSEAGTAAWNKSFSVSEDLIAQIIAAVKETVDLRYEAVFLPCKVSEWKALESVWRAAEEDPECQAYVIPIPYFYKKPDGSVGEVQYEAEQFPEDIPAIRYDTFDFESHCPDMIYIQNPYDAYDSAISVHPFFYASNLKKYTERLVYISPFMVDEIAADDARALENIKYCCVAPGVVHADLVIVQSENMRQRYIDILTEAGGAETRKIWEEKIAGLGSPEMDAREQLEKEGSELPDEWQKMVRKPDGSRKKIILYATDASMLLAHGEKILEKMRRVFDSFRKRKDEFALLWMPHELTGAGLEKHNPALWEKYEELMQEYIRDGWGICDTSGNISRAAVCDAYYGDRGVIAQYCLQRKVPVMIQNFEV